MAGNAAEAIAYIEGEGQYADRERFPIPALVITDLRTSGCGGFEVLAHLKSSLEQAHIPIVVLSGSENPTDIEKAFALGARSYHVKPLDFEELRELLKSLYDCWLASEDEHTGRQLSSESQSGTSKVPSSHRKAA